MTAGRTIRFLLGNRQISLSLKGDGPLSPTTTVLNWLRSIDGRKGTKEGCAEGDCGACTVVITEPSGDHLEYIAVNSCLLFLPFLHGKQLLSVEDLAFTANGQQHLHAVQEKLLKHHGAQCGYCTPGMVMSMFALYKRKGEATRKELEAALSGNLCRCTGYQSIFDAAMELLEKPVPDQFDQAEEKTIKALGKIVNEDLFLQNCGQEYFRPISIVSALDYLEKNPDCNIIHGGSDVALRQTKNNEILWKILDLSGVNDIKGIRKNGNAWSVGAGTSIEQMHCYFKDSVPAVSEMAELFGSRQIRHAATIGGNLGTASPIGDTLPLLMALKTKITLQGTNSARSIPVEEFITGYRTTARKRDELITSVEIPRPAKEVIRYYKVSKRKFMDIASVSAGFQLVVKDGIVKEVILAFGGMAAQTTRALKTEQFLSGHAWNKSTVSEATIVLREELKPISDVRADAGSRKILAGNLLCRFYEDTKEIT